MRLCGRMRPHICVHGRCQHQRGYAGQHCGGEQVVRDAQRQLGQRIGCSRCNHNHVGFLGQGDMRHLGAIQ